MPALELASGQNAWCAAWGAARNQGEASGPSSRKTSLQLDRIPPRVLVPQIHGTSASPVGVDTVGPLSSTFSRPAGVSVVGSVGVLRWIAVLALFFSLLGQGERCEIDPRFGSPGATIATYWEALRSNDTDEVLECFNQPGDALPHPGMLWFLPPTQRLGVYGVRFVPVKVGRLIATYEVRFRPVGMSEDMRFVTSSELVRMRGGWRIVSGAGEVDMPEWRPIPHRVDT